MNLKWILSFINRSSGAYILPNRGWWVQKWCDPGEAHRREVSVCGDREGRNGSGNFMKQVIFKIGCEGWECAENNDLFSLTKVSGIMASSGGIDR